MGCSLETPVNTGFTLFTPAVPPEQFAYEDHHFSAARGMEPYMRRIFERFKYDPDGAAALIHLDSFPELKKGLSSRYCSHPENIFLRNITSRLSSNSEHWRFVRSVGPLYFAADDSELCEFADRMADVCGKIIALEESPEFQLSDVFESYGFSTDFMKWQLDTETGELRAEGNWMPRVVCAKFWRRQIRRLCMRETEQIARQLGLTKDYLSEFTYQRCRSTMRRNQLILEGLEAENDLGQVFRLDELCELGVSNPIIRRGELMCRIRGTQEWAEQDNQEWQAVSPTLTVPSRFHSHTKLDSGKVIKNPKYDGSSPIDAMAWHNDRFARLRSRCQKAGIKVYGYVAVEPHHDGCPHIHALYWIKPEDCLSFQRIVSSLWCEEPEKGSDERRVRWVVIDPEMGSAVGYISKYISKGIDGYGVGIDDETGKPSTDSSSRVVAWARTWGIRQFRQVGGPPVTVWRELRRLANQPEHLPANDVRPDQFCLALEAADQGDWCSFISAMGGAICRRKDRPVWPFYVLRKSSGIYGDAVNYIRGLMTKGFEFPLLTRVREWTVRFSRLDRPKKLNQVIHSIKSEASEWGVMRAPQAFALDLCQ